MAATPPRLALTGCASITLPAAALGSPRGGNGCLVGVHALLPKHTLWRFSLLRFSTESVTRRSPWLPARAPVMLARCAHVRDARRYKRRSVSLHAS